MKRAKNELEIGGLKKHVRSELAKEEDCFVTMLEPSRGSSVGVPDLLVLMKRNLIPVEIKLGRMHWDLNNDGPDQAFMKVDLRPAQVRWHLEYAKAGGVSIILAGEYVDNDWVIAMARGAWADDLDRSLPWTFKMEDERIEDCLLAEYLGDPWGKSILRELG